MNTTGETTFVLIQKSVRIKSLLHFISSMHSFFFTNSPRHPYRTISKSRTMGDQEETQEQMKVDMSALKEQMASMMEAMLGMR